MTTTNTKPADRCKNCGRSGDAHDDEGRITSWGGYAVYCEQFIPNDPAPVGDLYDQAAEFWETHRMDARKRGIHWTSTGCMADFAEQHAASVTASDKARIEELEAEVVRLRSLWSHSMVTDDRNSEAAND